MKKLNLSLVLACMLWLAGTVPTLAASGESLDRIVNQIDSMFPPLEGIVVSVDKQILTLDLKQGQPVKRGDRLKLIRFGKDIIHPISKKKIGRKETDLGEVKVIEVRKDFSLARPTDPTTLVRVSDGVQSPFNKLTFLVATPRIKTKKKINRAHLRIELEEKLASNPRFKVPTFELDLWLLENNLSVQDMLKPKHLDKLNRQVKADYLLISSVRSIKQKLVLSYKLYSARTGQLEKQAKIMSDELPVKQSQQRSYKEQAVQRSFTGTKEGPVKYIGKQEFDFRIVDLDAGDINGDGREELVVLASNRVIVYEYRNKKLKQVARFRAKNKNNKFLGVDVGDINRNGRDEIFVTNQLGDSLSSFVLEVRRGKKRLQKTWDDVNLYFRVIHPFGKKPVLLTQSPGYNNPFRSPISKMVYRKGRYLPGKKLRLPSIHGTEFILYGFTLADINADGKDEIVMLDKDARLRVYSASGRVLVHSNEYYGRGPRMIEVGVEEEDIGESGMAQGSARESEPVQYRGRISFIRQGTKRYLLLPKNDSAAGSLVPGLIVNPRGSIAFLDLTREGFEKLPASIRKQKGYIAGHGILKPQKNTPKSLHMATVDEKSGLRGRTVSTVYSYFFQK